MRAGTKRGTTGVALALAALGLCPACSGKGPDLKSGADAAQEGAGALEVGKEITDSVSYSDGDRTDWKVVEIPASGTLLLDILWGNASARCTLRIYGAAGKELGRFDTIAPEPRKTWRGPVSPGDKVFLRFQCEDEGDFSAYLAKALFTPSAKPPPPAGAAGDEPGDGGDDGEGDGPGEGDKDPGAVGGGGGGGAGAGAEPGELIGEIKLLKKAKKGGSVLTIDKGTAHKVSVGMTGEIMGLSDATFTVTKVTAKTCTAESTLDPKIIGANVVVRFHEK